MRSTPTSGLGRLRPAPEPSSSMRSRRWNGHSRRRLKALIARPTRPRHASLSAHLETTRSRVRAGTPGGYIRFGPLYSSEHHPHHGRRIAGRPATAPWRRPTRDSRIPPQAGGIIWGWMPSTSTSRLQSENRPRVAVFARDGRSVRRERPDCGVLALGRGQKAVPERHRHPGHHSEEDRAAPPLTRSRNVWALALNNGITLAPHTTCAAFLSIEGDRLGPYDRQSGAQQWLARPARNR